MTSNLANKCYIITENDESEIQPKSIILTMKEHQLKLLNKCLELENNDITFIYGGNKHTLNTKIGVIGDRVGSGKSLVCLALTRFSLPDTDYKFKDVNSSILNISHQHSRFKYLNTNIIVVPHNVFSQWKGYIDEHTIIKAEYVNTVSLLNKLKYDSRLILVSSTMYNDFAKSINDKYYVSRVFFDEADSINISNCHKIHALFHWFVTSSIQNLIEPKGSRSQYDWTTGQYLPKTVTGIRRTGFIRDTFRSIEGVYTDYLKYIFLKNSEELIKKSFLLDTPIVLTCECKNTKILNILNNLVSDDIQQMICANNIDGAIKAMNVDKTDEDNLIKIVAHQFYDDIDNKIIELNAVKQKKYKNPELQKEHIIKIKKEIIRIEEKISDMQKRIKDSNMDPITYMPIENPTIVKCCTQVFDFESITMYITTTNSPKCPICRTDITKESLVIVTKDHIDDEEETKEDIKYEHIFENNEKDVNLTHILNEKIPQGSRLIIFSEYYETFDHVIKLCADYNIEYRTVKGNGNVIKNIVEWYNVKSDVTKILFLNARHAGAGLNLQATTDLIIYHKMVAELETQVIGRANRFGREGTLKIWKLLYSTEM
jgi:hypothetical protein